VAKKVTRETELCRRTKIEDKLIKLYDSISDGFIAQAARSDDQADYWDLYNCRLGNNQYYNGQSKIFVPLVHDAVNARATRFTNQIFPRGGRYVDAVSSDGTEPYPTMALLEHYVRKAKLRTEVAPALCVNGDVEGQYNVYVEWSTRARHVSWIEKEPIKVGGEEVPEELAEGVDTIKSDVILDEHPIVEVIPDADILILPITSNSIEEAIASGGSVTIIRRWTKGQLEEMQAAGEIDDERAEDVIKEMDQVQKQGEKNPAKKHADAAGIKAKGKVCQGYETWTRLKVGDEMRLCRILFGGDKLALSCKLNPNWSDRCSLISVPVKKVSGVAKGISQVLPTAQMQYAANDAVNEGMDSAAYALLPIVMTDPLKNPRVGSMVMDLAAVWETSPNDTKFATFPQLWKDAFEIVTACKMQVFQSLSVTPAMMPQGTGGKAKRNQAEIALEQQVDILTTADAVTVLEEGVFTPILERFAELDAQYRRDPVTIKAFGYLGMKAAMTRIEPLQLGTRYQFLWFGVEQARNVAQFQQQIALLNVVKGIPPQMMPGRRLNVIPAIEQAMSAIFGPRIAPLIFEDISEQLSYPPEAENEILNTGQLWPVSPLDNDNEHMQVHGEDVKAHGDPTGSVRKHIAQHRMSQIQKAMAAQQQQAPGLPGSPGGAGPGVAGTPKPGGQAGAPKNVKGPPGALHADRLPAAGAPVMPRKM